MGTAEATSPDRKRGGASEKYVGRGEVAKGGDEARVEAERGKAERGQEPGVQKCPGTGQGATSAPAAELIAFPIAIREHPDMMSASEGEGVMEKRT